MKKHTAYLLALLICMSAMSACGSDTSTESDNTTTPETSAEEIAAPETEYSRENHPDTLPELDFQGTDMIVHVRGESDNQKEIYMEEMTGDPVYDAVYERNQMVEERLNVSLGIVVGGAWDQYDQTIGEIRASIAAADGAYDAISGWSARIPSLSLEGLFLDLNIIPHLDLEQPWWNQSVTEELQIAEKLHFATGDIVISHLKPMSVYAFNQKIAADTGIENLYTVVNEHRWTIDYVNTLVADQYVDLNGDGARDAEDRYGLICSSVNDADGYMQGFRVSMVSRDANDLPVLEIDAERMSTIVDKVYNLMWANAGCYATTDDSTDMKAFASNHSLFVTTRIGDVMWQLADMESDYGLLPYPLLDESQSEYGTRVQDSMNLLCIPIDAQNTELSGAVLEALAAQSYRTVTPSFFDIALKNRYSRDEETAQMMDLIKDSVLINFESLYNESIGYPWTVLRSLMPQKSNNFASYWAGCENGIKTRLEEAVRLIQEQK
ncbi:MAG: hypothetical protein IKY52_00030 [Clostridia bacterium]|nr:hypothetical protein [Clostridia bacterium]